MGIKYRLLLQDEYGKILPLFKKAGIEISSYHRLFVAEKDGEIIGCCGLRNQVFIEPLVAENAVIGNGVLSRAEGYLIGEGVDFSRCITEQKNKKLFEKYGFEEIEPNKIIMEKFYR